MHAAPRIIYVTTSLDPMTYQSDAQDQVYESFRPLKQQSYAHGETQCLIVWALG